MPYHPLGGCACLTALPRQKPVLISFCAGLVASEVFLNLLLPQSLSEDCVDVLFRFAFLLLRCSRCSLVFRFVAA
jgi:hypothetical protein